jgi:ubiquitin thioesterase OTU1
MSKEIAIRCQTPQGTFSISHLTPSSSYLELQDVVEQITGIPPAQQKLLKGYPPQEISSSDVLLPIWSLGIQSGDSIIVEKINLPENLLAAMTGQRQPSATKQRSTSTVRQQPVQQNKNPAITTETHSQPFAALDPQQKNVKRKVVAANNSCLFASISFLFEGHSLAKAAELRQLAADVISSDPTTYSEVLLGKSNNDYVKWLRKDTSWGGSPELVVFSCLYQTEINVVDIQRVTLEEFGKCP